MAFGQVMEVAELLDSALVSGEQVCKLFNSRGWTSVRRETVMGVSGSTDFITVSIPGTGGKLEGGEAPTLGIVGRLGGIGARPAAIGLVSDGDGAVAALATALKLVDMAARGDQSAGDVLVTTHVCPDAPVVPHDPVPFMGSPVDMETMNAHEVQPSMDAILSIDTTRGNIVVNQRGFAITPTVKSGYILKVSTDLLRIMSYVTGRLPVVLPISTQDITPYGNGLEHINSIMQPATVTDAPVVGVALTAETAVPGCASGASQVIDIEVAVRFCIEVAKAYGRGQFMLHDSAEYDRLETLYGSMRHLQTVGC